MQVDTKEYGDFIWVEEVRGPLRLRENRAVSVLDGPPRPSDSEVYRSVFQSDGRLPAYIRERERQGNRSGIEGFDGPCTISFLPISINPEMRQSGQQLPDWHCALFFARRFFLVLGATVGIDIDSTPCCLTGERGVRILLPATLFGGFDPSPEVPKLTRAIAEELADDAGVPVDMSIYRRNQLLQTPNSRHTSGEYCAPVWSRELLELEEDELSLFMGAPRTDFAWIETCDPLDTLVHMKGRCLSAMSNGEEKRRPSTR